MEGAQAKGKSKLKLTTQTLNPQPNRRKARVCANVLRHNGDRRAPEACLAQGSELTLPVAGMEYTNGQENGNFYLGFRV